MTSIKKPENFIDELRNLLETKKNPDEWYFLAGQQVGEYSIHTAEEPDEMSEDQSDIPPEMRDATESVDSFYQIGTTGWGQQAFDDDVEFVREAGFSETFDKIDRRVNGLLLVHESVLSEKALEMANEEAEPKEAD
jgi:hypothetical protein